MDSRLAPRTAPLFAILVLMASLCNPLTQGPSVSPVSALQLSQTCSLAPCTSYNFPSVSRKLQIFLLECASTLFSLEPSSHLPWRHPATVSCWSVAITITAMLASAPDLFRCNLEHMISVRLACAALPQEEQRWAGHVPLPSRTPPNSPSGCSSCYPFLGISTLAVSAKKVCNASGIGEVLAGLCLSECAQRRPCSPIWMRVDLVDRFRHTARAKQY